MLSCGNDRGHWEVIKTPLCFYNCLRVKKIFKNIKFLKMEKIKFYKIGDKNEVRE